MKETGSRSFGTFRGVFIPTFLSIIGVIMYLRLGLIVGRAGILGTLLIIFLSVSVTFATGLSLSSITTNIRIGAGGAYSIISKTLGIEVGGSVAIPLFLAQLFSVALYIFGFTEGWQYIFPNHPRIIIILCTFAIIFLLTFISLKYAVQAQVIVFGIVLVSLGSIFLGGSWLQNVTKVSILTSFKLNSFWSLLTLFFPAVTGLMAGIGMSGELTDPKKQIPKGVLTGLSITTIIYVLMTFWFGYSANSVSLSTDNMLIVKLASFGPLVLFGILAATFSSALTTIVAAPRLLNSLALNGILPFSKWFGKRSNKGEPRNATLLVGCIVIILLLVGSLDIIAPILTMFFLITYSMINLVVFIEQSLGLVSFRPTFKISKFIPLYGFLMSVLMMFYISIFFGIIALFILFFIYLWLIKRKIETNNEDIRSGILFAFTEWAAKKISKLPESKKHTWKPNILFPAQSSQTLLTTYPLLRSILYPKGTLSVLGIDIKKQNPITKVKLTEKKQKEESEFLPELVEKFGSSGIFTTYGMVEAKNYIESVTISLKAIESQFFHPNIVLIPTHPNNLSKTSINSLIKASNSTSTGLVFFSRDEELSLGTEEDVNVWISSSVLDKDFYEDRPCDLALLLGYRIHRNWAGKFNIWMNVPKKNEDVAKSYLKRLIYEGRFPKSVKTNVVTNTLYQDLLSSPKGDIHIIAVSDEKNLFDMIKTTKKIKKTFLFVLDSTKEDILA